MVVLLGSVAIVVACYVLVYYFGFKGVRCFTPVKLGGKTAIVTGGNTGIGKATALELAKRGSRVILACRNQKKAEAAVLDICRESGNNQVVFMQLDLASLQSVRRFAETILKTELRVDILINNAGLMGPGCTEDSFSMAFGVNHLGHFLLTNLLLKRMQQCGPSRIVNVSALLHRLGNIDFSLLASKQDLETSQSIWHNFQDYCNSKLCNVLFTRELANMLECSNVTCYSLHPGIIYTELCRNMSMWQQFLLMPFAKLFFLDPEGGSQTTLYCALQEGIEALSGRYFSNCALQQVGHKGRDDALAKKLWEVSAGSGDCRKKFLSAPILSSVSKFTAIIGLPANREFINDSAELTDCTPLLNTSVTY
ncbi:dehydrogenase/reductase SDR family member 13 isoform X1 [Syngnathus scovelli]|uniref:dehydrogenase/reductase SDR family member 13 isoform X1 n=2 Tax=Syngnathus scovelli TaxID=161590 RepID=UPI00210F3090|nr:dehydrogenase/reductase SDR family member 13 isoform X1 [Syngnathus scovelli]